MILRRTITLVKIKDEYLTERRKKRCSRIASLNRIFLGRLRTWSGERRQKRGRIEREIESEDEGEAEEVMEIRRKNTMNTKGNKRNQRNQNFIIKQHLVLPIQLSFYRIQRWAVKSERRVDFNSADDSSKVAEVSSLLLTWIPSRSLTGR